MNSTLEELRSSLKSGIVILTLTMNFRDILLVVALLGNVWNVKAESGTNFKIYASYNDYYCSTDTEAHGKVSSDLFCSHKCSRIEGCVGFFYDINTRVCSTVKSVPQTGSSCETGTGSVFYMNPDKFKVCDDPPPLANGRRTDEVDYRSSNCNQFYTMKIDGFVKFETTSHHERCDVGPLSEVECVLGSHGINDDNITASPAENDHGPSNSRLDDDSAWIPNKLDQQQYLQYEFASPKIVNEIITQGGGGYIEAWTKSYKIHFSTDCVSFTEYEKVFNGNDENSMNVTNVIEPAILALCLQVNPQTWDNAIALRVELNGC